MKVGIIGTGTVACTMAKTLNQMEEAEPYAVASREKRKAEDFARKWGMKKTFGSYREMAEDEETELIYIATPHSCHYEDARLCLENGKPVLCEKAFMANADQAKEIIRLAEENGIFISEAIWTRYLPARKMIEQIIDSGEIGEVRLVTASFGADLTGIKRITDPSLAGGALLDLGVYPLTFASMVLGDQIEDCVSSCVKFETGVDAQNSVILKYRSGAIAALQSTALAGTDQRGIVYGTKGYLVAEHVNNIKLIQIYDRERKLIREERAPDQITGFEYEVAAAIRAVREGRIECEEMPHAESIFIMELMDGLRKEWGIKYPFD
ncbi:MAG TPA: Gfo/Idh/MocA family oxidoreductase [Candidatus Mediterraneibacter norfolkensis]|nr:Gfo/Idh/MocA family oxidoreductase [Candidatus Mediterraneibacter norfolkensis]